MSYLPRLVTAIILLIVGVNIVAADNAGRWTILGGGCLGMFVYLVLHEQE